MRFGVRPIRGLKNATLWVSTVSAPIYTNAESRRILRARPGVFARMHDERPFDEFGKCLRPSTTFSGYSFRDRRIAPHDELCSVRFSSRPALEFAADPIRVGRDQRVDFTVGDALGINDDRTVTSGERDRFSRAVRRGYRHLRSYRVPCPVI